MTDEEKDLLMREMCARIPDSVICRVKGDDRLHCLEYIDRYYEVSLDDGTTDLYPIDEIDFYLRPMSSMTNEEKRELVKNTWRSRITNKQVRYSISLFEAIGWSFYPVGDISRHADYLRSIHVDFKRLISRGLVKEAPEWMYDWEKWKEHLKDNGVFDEFRDGFKNLVAFGEERYLVTKDGAKSLPVE